MDELASQQIQLAPEFLFWALSKLVPWAALSQQGHTIHGGAHNNNLTHAMQIPTGKASSEKRNGPKAGPQDRCYTMHSDGALVCCGTFAVWAFWHPFLQLHKQRILSSLTCQQGRPWDCYCPVQEKVGTVYTSRVDGRNGRSRTGVILFDGSTVLQNKDIDYRSTRNMTMRNIYLLLTISWQLKRHLHSSM